MLDKIKALWSVLQAGKEVADAKKWKNRQITSTVLAALFIAVVQLLKVFGYDIPLDTETATTIAAGVLGAVNVVLTLATSKKVGIGEASDKEFPSLDN